MNLDIFKKEDKEYLFDSSLDAPEVDISDYPAVDWLNVLETMLKIRRTEELLGVKSAAGIIGTPVHLSIGQEAISAALALNLSNKDFAFGNHRSHGHYIAMGGDIYSLLAEILGKSDGCSSGMGGSMHITACESGFVGSVPIVAGTIPIAVGAGLYAKNNTDDAIGVAFFGDGAVEEGVFHESLNFAATHSVPVLFVAENNQFSSHMHLLQRQPTLSVARFALAHQIVHATIDGNNVADVYAASQELIQFARTERKPVFLEVVTYRWRAHVGPTEDIEVGYGRRVDLPLWKKRDPIARLVSALIKMDKISQVIYNDIDQKIQMDLENQFTKAENALYPDKNQLLQWVYSE